MTVEEEKNTKDVREEKKKFKIALLLVMNLLIK